MKLKIKGELTPTQAEIFNMGDNELIMNFYLIQARMSTRGAKQRRLVEKRIEFRSGKGYITKEYMEQILARFLHSNSVI